MPLTGALSLVANLDMGARHLPDLADLAAVPADDAADELKGQGWGEPAAARAVLPSKEVPGAHPDTPYTSEGW